MSARLSHKDYDILLACIGKLHACRSLEEFPQVTLRVCREAVACDSVTYNEIPLQPAARPLALAYPPTADNTPDLALQGQFQRYIEQNPILGYMRETGDGSARRISDFLTRSEFHALDLYKNFYSAWGLEYQVAFGLSYTGETVIGMALNRSSRDFSERARLMLNLLRPHCAQAYLTARDWRVLEDRNSQLEEALDATVKPVVLYSDRSVLLHATPAAKALLSQHFSWQEGARLPAAIRSWAEAERARQRGGGVLSAPLPGPTKARLTDHPARYFCSITFQETAPLDPRSLLPLGLTERECEVLVWMAEGKSNGEIATILGIGSETVKRHVQHILEKTDTPNRIAAVRLALECA